jgi:nucleotide-binding universal stress UspA family protein
MFKKILLPIDLTERHGPSIDIATDLAKPGDGEVVLLHVIEMVQGLSPDEQKSFYGQLESVVRPQLRKLLELVVARQVRCRDEIVYGNRGLEIVRVAAECGADLIVLTAPRIDPGNPASGWGSLSYKVGILSQCPVLLVK